MELTARFKAVARPRLTITPDRFELKIPSNLRNRPEEVGALMAFAFKVREALGEVKVSHRGRFEFPPEGGIAVTMSPETGKDVRVLSTVK